jgi:hypothetical protein
MFVIPVRIMKNVMAGPNAWLLVILGTPQALILSVGACSENCQIQNYNGETAAGKGEKN